MHTYSPNLLDNLPRPFPGKNQECFWFLTMNVETMTELWFLTKNFLIFYHDSPGFLP